MFTSKSRFIDVFSAMAWDDQETIVNELYDEAKYVAKRSIITNIARKNLSHILSEMTDDELREIAVTAIKTGYITKLEDSYLISELELRGYEVSKP